MKRFILPVFFICMLVFSMVTALLPSPKVAAGPAFNQPPQGTLTYSSATTIHVKADFNASNPQGQTVPYSFDADFVDGKIWDSHHNYPYNQSGCGSSVGIATYGSPTGQVELVVHDPYNAGQCDSYSYIAPIGNTDLGRTLFNWTSKTQITSIEDGILLGQTSNPHVFTATVSHKDLLGNTCAGNFDCYADCRINLTLQSDNKTGNADIICSPNAPGIPGGPLPPVHITNILVAGSPDSPVTTTPPPGSGGTSPKVDCSWSLNPLTWFLCPALQLVQNVMSEVGKWIFDFLQTPNVYFQPSSGNKTAVALYSAWGKLRLISLVILAIMALLMILSQALSFGPFDAYTVKKVLPRMVVAAIFITLSWAIIGLMVALSNALGDGVRFLIYAPFQSLPDPNISGSSLAAGNVGLAAAGLALGILGMLSLGLTAALALLVGFFVIILRQILVLFLAILAPIAIVCYILPGTSKVWDIWWDSFSGVLLMFPLITGIIAIGSAFAKVAAAGGSSTVYQVVAFIAVYAPYFLLPAAIRLAGGAIARIGGAINDRGRGAFDRLKAFRQAQVGKNWQDTKGGNRFKGGSALSKRASRSLQTATLVGAGGLTFSANERRARMQTARGSRNFDLASEFLEKNAAAQAIKGDDDKLWAVMEGHDDASIRASLIKHGKGRFSDPGTMEKAVAEVKRFQREAGSEVGLIAATRAQATTGTGFNYGVAGDDMMTAINMASGADRGLSGRMLGEMRSSAMQSGRVDLGAAGFAVMAKTLDDLRTAEANGGYLIDSKAPGGRRRFGVKEAREVVMDSVIDSSGGSQAVYGKPTSAAAMGTTHLRNIQTIMNSVATNTVDTRTGTVRTERELKQAIASAAGLYDAMASASPQNARAYADTLMGANITVSQLPPSIQAHMAGGASSIDMREVIDNMRQSDQEFLQMRREYGAATSANARNGQIQAAIQQNANRNIGIQGPPPGLNQGPP